MNILVSDKWLREYVRMKQTPEQFAAAISLVGPSAERIHDQGAALDKVVVGRIVELGKHPNADKLRLATVDIGAKSVKVVCGGSNLSVGQLVALAQVGARVRWHGQGELVTLEPAVIRGAPSEGMICAADEIGLGDRFPASSEKEILDLTSLNLKVGQSLAKALGLDDKIYDIEVTTNRPDCLGIVGLAREAAAATGGTLLWKEPAIKNYKSQRPNYKKTPKSKIPNSNKLKVSIQDKRHCSRYQGALIEGVTVKDSPAWMQERLVCAGLRPINAIVDITNYVMLELGQPMHAFDAGKVEGRTIVVRGAKAGERIKGLDGVGHALAPGMLVIADAVQPIAVAGIIGGLASGVTEKTRSVILEAASFESASVRKTGRALNLRTDAVARFEKNLPSGLTAPAMARAVELVLEICGGTVIDFADVIAKRETAPRLTIAMKTLSGKIGVDITAAEAKKNLTTLGFKVAASASKLTAQVPYWRVGDVGIPEDLVEEVARLHGYHRLPSVLPSGVSGEAPDSTFAVEDKLRDALIAAGAYDLMSISIVGEELLVMSGESETPVMRLANPLTVDLACLQPSYRARLLAAVRTNEKACQAGSAFEIGKVFIPPVDEGELPEEVLSLGLAVWDRDAEKRPGELFFRAKGLVERLARAAHAPLTFGRDFPKNLFWHPGRTASIHIGTAAIGTIGELSPDARRKAGIESRLALALIDLAEIVKAAKPSAEYHEPPSFPPVLRDIAFVLPRKAEHELIVAAVKSVDPLIASVELFDHYEGQGIEEGKKSLAYHLTYQAADRTLTATEVDAVHVRVAQMLEHKFKAKVRE